MQGASNFEMVEKQLADHLEEIIKNILTQTIVSIQKRLAEPVPDDIDEEEVPKVAEVPKVVESVGGLRFPSLGPLQKASCQKSAMEATSCQEHQPDKKSAMEATDIIRKFPNLSALEFYECWKLNENLFDVLICKDSKIYYQSIKADLDPKYIKKLMSYRCADEIVYSLLLINSTTHKNFDAYLDQIDPLMKNSHSFVRIFRSHPDYCKIMKKIGYEENEFGLIDNLGRGLSYSCEIKERQIILVLNSDLSPNTIISFVRKHRAVIPDDTLQIFMKPEWYSQL